MLSARSQDGPVAGISHDRSSIMSMIIQANEIRDIPADELDTVSGGAFSFGVGFAGISVGSDRSGSVHFFNGGNAYVVGSNGSVENWGPTRGPK
jgi:hypothetical protein